MTAFSGFPAKTRYVPLPKVFFGEILPAIGDIAELKVTLHAFQLLFNKRGYPKYVTLDELAGEQALMRGLMDPTSAPEEALCRGLELAVSRGTFLHLTVRTLERNVEIYFLNTEVDRRAAAKIERGELDLGQGEARVEIQSVRAERPNIFSLYEQNIGIMTPLVADELREAEKLYPAGWIEEAFKEAVQLNKRNLRYILRILESWATEGKHDGKSGRDSKEDTEKYFRGKFGHLVQR
ncbi:MAG: DnaD domain protein [Dehalococcoidia bacterium]|nr:DnaD domain protein [Dehalococcoidia bacterium]